MPVREIFDNQAMALWLYDTEDYEGRENGEDEANQATVTEDDTKGQSKVYPNMEDDAKSIPAIFNTKNDTKSVPASFDDSELVSMLMDPNMTLSKGQHFYNLAEMANMRGIPYQKGSSLLTHVPMGTSPVANLTIPVATQLIGKTGATCSETVKHDLT